jgi:flagellar basal body P-ring protein FlgI
MTRTLTCAYAAILAATFLIGADKALCADQPVGPGVAVSSYGPSRPGAATSRIKDLANIEGVRQNQLIGYGLVVGLNNTGDTLQNIPFTKQSLQAMLERPASTSAIRRRR